MNNQLKNDIAQVIKTNGNQEITGALLQSTLIAIVNELGRFGRYAGVATPQTVPETENGVFYLANGAGTYTNFGVTVSDNILAFITNMSGTYTVTGINKNLLLSGAVLNLLPDDVARLNSSVVGGNLESPRNVANSQTPVAITNTTLNDKGISKMITAGLANSRVECYIEAKATNTSDTLVNIFNANKGKYIKVRWYVYSRFNVPPTMGVAANRMGVNWQYTDNTYSNAGIQNQTLTQIASGVWQFQQIFQYNVTKNLNYVLFANVWAEEQAGQMTNPVAGDNGFSGLSVWIADDPALLGDDLIVEDWINSEYNPNKLITGGQADERYMTVEQANETFAQKSVVDTIIPKFKLNSFITGGNFNPVQDLQSTVNRYMIKDNAFLVDNQTPNIAYEVKGSNNNVEVYVSFNAAKIAEYFQNAGKYIKIKYWVYSKNGVMATATTRGRLGVLGTDDNVSYNNGQVTYKKVDDQIFEVTMQWQIHQAAQPTQIWICTVWEAAIVPADFVKGDLGVTGFGVWYADSLAQLDDNIVQYDWMPPSEDSLLTIEAGDARYMKISDNPALADYNNIPYNQTAIAEFLRKYTSKTVDANNQINIALVGDSIFGRVDKSRGFDPANPEVTLTPDVNNPSETQPGYITGHFPPNMWEQIVAFKVLQLLQYPDADVKYFNHVASEITKSGTWVDRFPVGADCLRTATTTVQNSAMTLAFSGASFVKFVYSCYGYNSAGRKIQVQFSDDNGTTWKTPADLGLTEKLASSADGSGIYVLPTRVYKFGNNVWGGLDKTKSYQIRVTFIDTTGTLNVWGFETWSNPRVNVVVTAEGGNTASNQKYRWERFYSQMYDQDLTIYELPYLNDLGAGVITNYKGQVTPTSTPAANPAQYDFYYATTAGTYTNFGGVVAYAGAYIEWSGTAWVLGSTKVAQTMATYQSNNMAVFERLRKTGVPVLTIVTHDCTIFATRPYTWGLGLFLLRLMVKQYGFGCIDLNRYQQQYDISDIWSDGTHLNDKGVQMYADLINEVMTSETEFVVWAFPQMNNIPLKGTSSANTVNFGIEFKKVPTVRLYNTTQVVASVTQSGFTTTGSGSYDWEAIIE